jgi:flagellar biosynthesis component FlhA
VDLKEELLDIEERDSVMKLFDQTKRIKFYSGMLTFFVIGTILGIVGLPILVWVLAIVLMFMCFYLTKERRQLEKELHNKVHKHYQEKRNVLSQENAKALEVQRLNKLGE